MKLKELRKEHKLTQDEVAKILNVSRATYNGYELNKYEPNIASLCKIAELYNITLDELVGRETNLINIASLDEYSQAIIKQLNSMSDKEKHLILQFIEFLNNKG